MVTIRASKFSKIKKELNKKKEELIDILPDFLKEKFKKESYIAGGSIYSMFHENSYKDIDIFIRSRTLSRELLTYFKNSESDFEIKFLSEKKIYTGRYKGFDLTITNNAISIGKFKINLKNIGDPMTVVSQFDFQHSMYYIEGNSIFTLNYDNSALLNKELVYNEARAQNIAGTIIRVPKFISRGMTISNKEMAKILLKLHKVGFNENEVDTLKNYNLDQFFGS